MEYKACTERVAVVDLTSLGLFEIEVRQTDIDQKETSLCVLKCLIMSSFSIKSKVLLND